MTPRLATASPSRPVRSTAQAPTTRSGQREWSRPSAGLFPRPPALGAKTEKPSAADVHAGAARSVYPKPLQRRADRMHRAAHHDAVAGLRLSARQLAPRIDRGGELEARSVRHESRRQPRCAHATRSRQGTHDPVVDDGCEDGPDRRRILVREYAHHAERASLAGPARLRQGALAQLCREYACGRLVVGDVEDPLHSPGNDLEASREAYTAERCRHRTLIE